jgi:aryl-alcohol dehydrogenase-like predicted oxidoreductase
MDVVWNGRACATSGNDIGACIVATLPRRNLGASGLSVSALGLGCMSFSGAYGPSDDEAAIGVIHAALDQGVTFFDSSDMYGWGHNETLLGRALGARRSQIVLATKFGQTRREGGSNGVDGRPAYVKEACETSLKRLGTEVIDLYYQHRVDPMVPIEETVGAMAELVREGKVRALGLSEARPETIRRAHKVHKIAAVQSEFSLLYRVEAEETLRTTRELGISFVAYSPLGRSLLTGKLSTPDDMKADDPHRRHPRFAEGNLARNLGLIEPLRAIAAEKGCTLGQLVLAWLLAREPDIVPIPGTKRPERLAENLGALSVRLSQDEVERMSELVPTGAASGLRYPEGAMKAVFL